MTNKIPAVLDRGKFLQLCTRIAFYLAGCVGFIGLVRYFSYKPAAGRPSTFYLGPTDDFPSSGTLLRLDIPAVIYRKEHTFQAFSLICTHLGCTLVDNGKGFACPCHGSEFDSQGRLIKGPAQTDLDPLEVVVTEEGDLLVHSNGVGP